MQLSEQAKKYLLEASDSLTDGIWLPITNVTGNAANIVIDDPEADQQRFYRIKTGYIPPNNF